MRFSDQKPVRRLFVLMALLAIVGCSTPTDLNPPSIKQGDVVVDDTVLALGIPNEELANQMGNTKTVVFLGKNKTYLLVDGGQRLASLRQQLDNKRLTLMTSQKEVYVRDQVIWGDMEFRYVAPASGVFSEAERQTLTQLEFTLQNATTYLAKVRIQGALYPALPMSANTLDLRQARRVVFYAPPEDMSTPDLSSLVKLPSGLKIGY